ncbi:MAG: polyphosphate:AMP phosphotransferase, partial [bacterium]|nr:polyphosphate:AMP phosphotransferase [bacterium]
ELLQVLDPRGVNVYSTQPPSEEERMRPFLWRFWTKTPARGRIAIFDRSWYGRFLVDKMDTIAGRMPMHKAYEEVNSFERQLVDDGHVMIKFFLHISQEEQRRRFKKLEENPMTAWRVTDYDWQKHMRYDTYREVTEGMIRETNTEYAPWHVISAQDWRFATVEAFEIIIDRVSLRIQELKSTEPLPAVQLDPVPESMLATSDLSLSLSRKAYDEERKKYQDRIWELEHEIYRRRLSVVIVYEGWDAAGKGGNIKRLVRKMDPRGYEVIPVSAPNDVELAHHYLWRFWMKIPKAGHFAIFDRSWYGRVLVERVEGLATEYEWKRAYKEINEFEEQLANYGTKLFKFWIDIGQDMQLNRFEDRQETPTKQWKIMEEDWRNREKWDVYKEAVDDMLWRTNTPYAPWTIVESNCKLYARIKTLKTVTRELEKYLIEY